MRNQGLITLIQEQQAKSKELVFQSAPSDINQTAPHFALMVKDALIEKYGEQQVANSGYTVKTTLDLSLQEYAEQAVKNQVLRLQYNKVTNGAAVVMDPKTGDISALVGSWNWEDETNGKINMAIRARQPGSSFKPIIYAKAFEDRLLTPGSVLEDKQITFPGGYKPKNYDNRFRGPVTVRRALANSLNIPAVLTMQAVGVSEGIRFAEKLGITTLKNPADYGLSLVLGAAEVPLIQMTDAYAVFANSGKHVKPNIITTIQDRNGSTIYSFTPDTTTVIPSTVAFLISSILSDNNARSEVFGNSLTISRPAAVKTGTTENYKDSLTIGYTPSLVVGVWLGNNDNTAMDGVAGSSGAAPIWRQLMEKALAGTPVQQFIPPLGVIKQSICKENGLKATIATSSAYPEYFLSGTLPTKDCFTKPTDNPSPSESPTNKPDEPTQTPEPTNSPEPTPASTPTSANPTPTTEPIIQITVFPT
jgi:membrane peptidoglycan carboxypeptidase